MQAVTLVYDLFIFCFYIVTITLALVLYKIGGHKPCGLAALLFTVYLFDHLVITLTELVPAISEAYDRIFLMVPSVKTLVYACSFSIMILLLKSDYAGIHYKRLAALLLIVMVALLFIPMLPNSAWKSWIYFFPAQVFLFCYALTGILQMRRVTSHVQEWKHPHMKHLFLMMLIFSILIVAEDTYVIFNVDQYTNNVSLFNRNVSEDIMRLLQAYFSVRTMISLLFAAKEEKGEISVFTDCTKMVPDASPISDVSETSESGVSGVNDGAGVSDGNERAGENDASGAKDVSLVNEMADANEMVTEDNLLDATEFAFCQKYQFTIRESEIFSMLLKSMTNQEISETLMVSLGTVKTHTHNIFSKLDVSNRKQAIQRYAAFKNAS